MRIINQKTNLSEIRRSLNEARKHVQQAQALRGEQITEIDAQINVLKIKIDSLLSLLEASEGIVIRLPIAAKTI